MSKEYDKYLQEHIGAVQEAAQWMVDNLPSATELSNYGRVKFLNLTKEHDESKFTEEEYFAYDAYFYGTPDEDEFNLAWLHHIHNNPHHWQHWILVNGYGKFGDPGVVTALEMPKVYALEMVADWWSFSWRSGNLTEVFDWYERHKDSIVLHPNTREYVEHVLFEIGESLKKEMASQ